MRGHRFLNVVREVFVDGCRGVFRKQSDALLDRATGRRRCAENGQWRGARFDNNLRARAHMNHQPGEIAGRLGFRNVDHCHI